jgi:hypothetical protein
MVTESSKLACKQLLPKKIKNPDPTATLHPSTIFFFFASSWDPLSNFTTLKINS